MERYLIPRNIALVAACVFISIAILHMAGISSAERIGGAIPLFCPFKALTGIPCPGCGMTRALISMTKGDFHAAFRHNPFSFFLLFMIAISIAPGKQVEKLFPIAPAFMNYFFIVVLGAILVFWFFARLLPAL
jgi:hypothetical protein